MQIMEPTRDTSESGIPEFLKNMDTIEDPTFQYLKSLKVTNLSIYRGRYEAMNHILKHLQVFLAAVGLIFFLSVPIWKPVYKDSSTQDLLLIGFEMAAWIGFLCLIGWQNIPANFVSIFLQRCFVLLDVKYSKNLHAVNITEVFLETFTKSKAEPTDFLVEKANSLTALVCGSSFAIGLTFLTQVNVCHCDTLCLVGTVLASVWTTVVLLSAMLIEIVGKENHLFMCKCWTYLMAAVTTFVALFLFQRMCRRLRVLNRITNLEPHRTILETIIFLQSVYLGVLYIPVIHPGFSFVKLFNDEQFYKMMTTFIPKDVLAFISFDVWPSPTSNYVSSFLNGFDEKAFDYNSRNCDLVQDGISICTTKSSTRKILV